MSGWCSCCKDEIEYNFDDLTVDTQILPKREKRNDLIERNQKEFSPPKLSPTNNYLITFGSVTYGKVIDLNTLLKKPNTIINVKKIAFGDIHSLFLFETYNENQTKNTHLYGYGSNNDGQLGLEYTFGKQNEYKYLVPINLDSYLVKGLPFFNKKTLSYYIDDIEVGNGFSLISIKYHNDDNIALYRFQLKKEDKYDTIVQAKETKKATIFKENFNVFVFGNIIQFKCFGDRTIILTNKYLLMKGTLYNMDTAEDYKIIIEIKQTVLNLQTGINDCIILDSNSNLLLIGHGEYGEFGVEKTIDILESGKYLINDYFNKYNLTIVKISTGARHSLVLCDNGNVYCFGDNSDGQCVGYEKIVSSPSIVDFGSEKEFIVDIQAGFNHSMAKSKSGKVYVWGDSAWDKLGFKETRVDQFTPVEVSDMKIRNVIRMFAGPLQSTFFISGGIPLIPDQIEDKKE